MKEIRIEMARINAEGEKISDPEEKISFFREELEIQMRVISSMECIMRQQDRKIDTLTNVIVGQKRSLSTARATIKNLSRQSTGSNHQK